LLRSIPALVALGALVAAVPSAAQVGSGRIAYATDGTGIYTVAADGSDPVTLKSDNARLPRWSPDGSKLAFIEYVNGPHRLGVELKVINADGSNEHVVATADWWQDIWLSSQPWSADGSRIAWGPSSGDPGGDIYTASAAGGDVRRITADVRRKEAPVWSPTGPQLVYSSSLPDPSAHWQLFSALEDGSTPVQIKSGTRPSWSPDGTWIAFVDNTGVVSAIDAVHPDGTGVHRVTESFQVGPFAWSPDSSKIAFTTYVPLRKYLPPGQEISVAYADGSGVRQLTDLGQQSVFDDAPTWSPDGDRILFRRIPFTSPPPGAGPLWTMNPDGTCQGELAAVASWELPSWQALPGGPAVGRKTCAAALALDAARTPNATGSAITIRGTITNGGTEPLTNVMLEISAPGLDLTFERRGTECTRETEGLFCEFARLDGGESREVTAFAMARRVGLDQNSRAAPLRVRLHATAKGASGSLQRTDELFFTPSRCVTLDPGSGGRIYGTRFADQLCGRRGADSIHPGQGKDRVSAGAGPDVIYAVDKARDVISCGSGRDLVIANRTDKVAGDCERVRRKW
jgi:Tol biopolymer transport system component